MNIRPGTRLQIGPHVIEVRQVISCFALEHGTVIDIVDACDDDWTIFFFHHGRIAGKHGFGGEMMAVGEISTDTVDSAP